MATYSRDTLQMFHACNTYDTAQSCNPCRARYSGECQKFLQQFFKAFIYFRIDVCASVFGIETDLVAHNTHRTGGFYSCL